MTSESTKPVDIYRSTSISLTPLEYFTDSTNTINVKSDVIIIAGNEKFYCHRLLLALASPVFARMFDGEFREHDDREINLHGKKSEIVLELLKCIYPQFSGSITNDNVDEFLLLADEYMIESLKKPCQQVLLDQLTHFVQVALPTTHRMEQVISYQYIQLLIRLFCLTYTPASLLCFRHR